MFTLNFRRNEFRHRLENRMTEVDSLLRKNPRFPDITLEHIPPGTLPEENTYYKQVKDKVSIADNGKTIVLADIEQLKEVPQLFVEKDRRSYLLKYDDRLQQVVIVSAIDVFGFTKMQNLRKVLLAGILIGTLAMALISWYLPWRALKPISNKIKKARRIGGESLNIRLDVKNDYDELGELAITFNQMLDRIEKAFESQKKFVSNASHELRNPVTAISGDAQFALMRDRNPEEYRDALKRIKDKSEVLKKVIERLLILSKIETDKSNAGKSAVRIDELLIDTIASVQDSSPGLKTPLLLHIEETSHEAYQVYGDPVMIKVALYNIIENAVKYGEEKPVAISLCTFKNQSVIRIKDEGKGIEEEENEKLFHPFYREEGIRHIQGTGIGLSLVKNIIDWHGWGIKLTNNTPNGTIVEISFLKE